MMLAAGAPRVACPERRPQPGRSRTRSRALRAPATCHAHKSSVQPSAFGLRGGVAGALAALLSSREQSGSTAPPPDVDSDTPSKKVLRVRSLFLSDIHLVRFVRRRLRGGCQLGDRPPFQELLARLRRPGALLAPRRAYHAWFHVFGGLAVVTRWLGSRGAARRLLAWAHRTSRAPPSRRRERTFARRLTAHAPCLALRPQGTAGCQAEPLLELLRSVQCDTLYLVGDVVDGWELSSSRVFWPQSHSDVVQKLLRKARRGTRIFYLPGNHDEAVRDFLQDTVIELGNNIIIQQEAVHFTADGRRFLVLHGDRCDLTPHIRTDLNYQLKSLIYRAFQAFNRVIKSTRRRLSLPYWSLASTVNTSVGAAAKLIANYEQALAAEARYQKMDGVICGALHVRWCVPACALLSDDDWRASSAGHIHHAALRDIEGVTYANTGDWVDSMSCLVEQFDGTLQIIRWLDVREQYVGSGKQYREPKSAALDFLEDETTAR